MKAVQEALFEATTSCIGSTIFPLVSLYGDNDRCSRKNLSGCNAS